MTNPSTGLRFDPARVRSPIQIVAIFFVALVVLVTLNLETAVRIRNIPLAWVLVVSAIAFVVGFVGLAFVLLTRFRPLLQDDRYYFHYLKTLQNKFVGFRAEAMGAPTAPQAPSPVTDGSTEGETERIRRYESNQGLFLVHRWLPSQTPGQLADIVIEVTQHGDGPLSEQTVDKVHYYLGPKFFGHKPLIKDNGQDKFRLEISAYGPLLCLAEVFVRGLQKPIVLDRYLDFET